MGPFEFVSMLDGDQNKAKRAAENVAHLNN